MDILEEVRQEMASPRLRYMATGFAVGSMGLAGLIMAMFGFGGYALLPVDRYLPRSDVESHGYTRNEVLAAVSDRTRALDAMHRDIAKQLADALRELSAKEEGSKKLRSDLAAAQAQLRAVAPRPNDKLMGLSLVPFSQQSSVRACEERALLALEDMGFFNLRRQTSGVVNGTASDDVSTTLASVVCSINSVIVAQHGAVESEQVGGRIVARMNQMPR